MKHKRIFRVLTVVTLVGLLSFTCSNKIYSKKETKTSKDKTIKMKWIIPTNKSIKYETVMNVIGNSTFEMDFGKLFNKIIDSALTDKENLGKDFFNKLQKSFSNTNLLTILSNSSDFDNVVDIKMITKEKKKEKKDTNEISSIMQSMMKGVMLRGSVYKTGKLHSFWLKSSQKNLLSLFFELPEKELKIGDTWTLNNVNFIANDQNFICKKANKKNIVTLTDIKKDGDETIAVIDYDILEYVSGDFNNPFAKESTKTSMEFIYKANAKFSIEEGKWVSYNGIMSFNASGFMISKQKKKFALIEQK